MNVYTPAPGRAATPCHTDTADSRSQRTHRRLYDMLSKSETLPVHETASPEARRFLKTLHALKPAKRPTAQDVLRDPFLAPLRSEPAFQALIKDVKLRWEAFDV